MLKIFKFSSLDMLRGRWVIVYFLCYLILASILLFLNNDVSSGIVTMMNIIIILTPLIGTIFSVMYYYSSREFVELLLAQPIKRTQIFGGLYLGVGVSLSLSIILGLGIPFIMYGIIESGQFLNLALLLICGTGLTFTFVGLSMVVCLKNSNRIKGFGYAILIWLLFAVIYDGIFLTILMVFKEYPLDSFALIASMINPIDLSRIIVLLKMDISALLGYTGAVFQNFLGTNLGLVTALILMVIWVISPVGFIFRIAARKDFELSRY